MRLNRGYLILGTLVVLVLGSMFGLASQERVGFTPLKVGEPKQDATHRTSLDSPTTEETQSSSESSIQDETLLRMQAKRNNSQQNPAVTISGLQLDADNAIAEARYEQAAQDLQEIVRLQKGTADARVHFKLAVCREALGDDYSALEGYQQTINSTHFQPLQTAARLGQCRVWSRKDKEIPARNELYSILLNHRDSLSNQTSERIYNQLALASTKCSLLNHSGGSILSDHYIYLPVENITVEEIISELVRSSRKQKPQSNDSASIQNVLKLDESADSILFEVVSSSVTMKKLLEQLCASVNLSFTADQETLNLLESRTQKVSFRGVPFSIVLDALLVPLNLSWTQQQQVISIRKGEDRTPEERSLQAERLLKYAISASPDHPLAPYCHFSLASLKHEAGNWQSALREYERALSLYPDVPFASKIWVNIGKCRLKLKQADAIDAFHRAIDLGVGGEIEAVAHAYVGRIHLAQDSPQQAYAPLQRAKEIITDPEMLAELRLLKAAACYMNSQSKLGLEVLSLCVEHLKTNQSQNQFTILALLLKSQASNTHSIRERDAASMLTALSNLQRDKLFGEHWSYLVAQAYHERGFQGEVERITQEFHQKHFNLQLARRFRKFSDSPVLTPQNQNLKNSVPMGMDQFFANEKQSPATEAAMIQYCRQLLMAEKQSDEERLLTLQKLGAIYQRQGNHKLAIQCFTDSYSAIESEKQ